MSFDPDFLGHWPPLNDEALMPSLPVEHGSSSVSANAVDCNNLSYSGLDVPGAVFDVAFKAQKLHSRNAVTIEAFPET
jgi:hypothetical protein